MKGRMLSRVGTLVVIAFLVWRMAGAPGLGGSGGSGLAAGGYVAQELESVTETMRAQHGTSGPGIHPVGPDRTPAEDGGGPVTVLRGR